MGRRAAGLAGGGPSVLSARPNFRRHSIPLRPPSLIDPIPTPLLSQVTAACPVFPKGVRIRIVHRGRRDYPQSIGGRLERVQSPDSYGQPPLARHLSGEETGPGGLEPPRVIAA